MNIVVRFSVFVMAGALPLWTRGVARAGDAPKKILFFSKSSEYEDNMVRRVNGQASVAEKVLGDLGKEDHLVFTFTKDGSLFTAENLATYDAFCFFTSGDLTQRGYDDNPPVSPAGKAALLEAIRNGKGFVGIHSAADTFRADAPGTNTYLAMVGGELLTRIRLEASRQIVVDTNFPGLGALPENFMATDEWLALGRFSTNLHVLLMQDTSSMVRGTSYGPNFPSTWARQYGRGRVFYTSMGHQEAVWRSPAFQQILAGGLKWAVGDIEADVTPNLVKAMPATATH